MDPQRDHQETGAEPPDLRAHIERSSKILRERLMPREQVLSASPSLSPARELPLFPAGASPSQGYGANDPHNRHVKWTDDPGRLRSAGVQNAHLEEPSIFGGDLRSAPFIDRRDNRFNERPPAEDFRAIARSSGAERPLRASPARNRGGLSPAETEVLVGHLLKLVNLARKLESTRMDLACMPDFNLMDAFSLFDEEGQGYCS